MNEHGPDFIVSELLSELKAENSRKDTQLRTLYRVIAGIVLAAFIIVGCVVAGFLWYLNQYDFSATEWSTQSVEGVYAIIDSEGNVVGQDLTADQLAQLMEVVEDGEGSID